MITKLSNTTAASWIKKKKILLTCFLSRLKPHSKKNSANYSKRWLFFSHCCGNAWSSFQSPELGQHCVYITIKLCGTNGVIFSPHHAAMAKSMDTSSQQFYPDIAQWFILWNRPMFNFMAMTSRSHPSKRVGETWETRSVRLNCKLTATGFLQCLASTNCCHFLSYIHLQKNNNPWIL